MDKLILVIIDGLNAETANEKMGFMKHMEEVGAYKRATLQCELPSLSRPMYETILTGKRPIEHGILSNQTVRLSREKNIFSVLRDMGLTTAAAAYHWISELYNVCPFDYFLHRIQSDPLKAIQHGIFYWEDQYPDSHVFLDANHLLQVNHPDFLLVHPMNVDFAGHEGGSKSLVYGHAARKMDVLLSHFLPLWEAEGYQVIVTSDHGMGEDRAHGGDTPQERLVPYWHKLKGDVPLPEFQTNIFHVMCRALQIKGEWDFE